MDLIITEPDIELSVSEFKNIKKNNFSIIEDLNTKIKDKSPFWINRILNEFNSKYCFEIKPNNYPDINPIFTIELNTVTDNEGVAELKDYVSRIINVNYKGGVVYIVTEKYGYFINNDDNDKYLFKHFINREGSEFKDFYTEYNIEDFIDNLKNEGIFLLNNSKKLLKDDEQISKYKVNEKYFIDIKSISFIDNEWRDNNSFYLYFNKSGGWRVEFKYIPLYRYINDEDKYDNVDTINMVFNPLFTEYFFGVLRGNKQIPLNEYPPIEKVDKKLVNYYVFPSDEDIIEDMNNNKTNDVIVVKEIEEDINIIKKLEEIDNKIKEKLNEIESKELYINSKANIYENDANDINNEYELFKKNEEKKRDLLLSDEKDDFKINMIIYTMSKNIIEKEYQMTLSISKILSRASAFYLNEGRKLELMKFQYILLTIEKNKITIQNYDDKTETEKADRAYRVALGELESTNTNRLKDLINGEKEAERARDELLSRLQIPVNDKVIEYKEIKPSKISIITYDDNELKSRMMNKLDTMAFNGSYIIELIFYDNNEKRMEIRIKNVHLIDDEYYSVSFKSNSLLNKEYIYMNCNRDTIQKSGRLSYTIKDNISTLKSINSYYNIESNNTNDTMFIVNDEDKFYVKDITDNTFKLNLILIKK